MEFGKTVANMQLQEYNSVKEVVTNYMSKFLSVSIS